ncbi:short-chain dehydrogenase/reductase SDR [Caballeronia turbans]|jgi:NAD(P)-dependent dehydrogenase (short-subunit alcohol dehydrogenase family)|uniref:SDR family NAD(P)-dependent oxidoreductase n=1 Tax=unclassified Caballeronia TaxID=2646786 RepID=UPI00074C17AC|nr:MULTISPECIES: SDR family oxidoreductase [unclassified Caballeronia]SAL29584.1 short-chain dehydrogenase/reductase SDR [Caballeronia turbans]
MSYAIYPSLADKRVVVTGGGSGIGAAIVEAFAKQGARVFFIDVAEADSRQLEQALASEKHAPTFLHCDLRDTAAIEKAFDDIASEAGSIDVLVNNAANDDRHQWDNVSSAYWDERMAVNLRHQFFCAQAAAERMRTQKHGAIVNMGSISWHLALPDLTLYMTAKAAIEGLTRGLARELGEHGIRVNTVIPGAVRTPRQTKLWQSPESGAKLLAQQCLHERIDPEHIARMVLFLASDDAARCTARDYYVDAGWFGT